MTIAAYDAVAFFVSGSAGSPTSTTALAGSTSATLSYRLPSLVSVTFSETATTSVGQVSASLTRHSQLLK